MDIPTYSSSTQMVQEWMQSGVDFSCLKTLLKQGNVPLLVEAVCILLDHDATQFSQNTPFCRFTEQQCRDYLAINKGYCLAPLCPPLPNVLFNLRDVDVFDFFRILRTRTDWTSTTFRKAYAESEFLKYKQHLATTHIHIPPSHYIFYLWSKLIELAFAPINHPETGLQVVGDEILNWILPSINTLPPHDGSTGFRWETNLFDVPSLSQFFSMTESFFQKSLQCAIFAGNSGALDVLCTQSLVLSKLSAPPSSSNERPSMLSRTLKAPYTSMDTSTEKQWALGDIILQVSPSTAYFYAQDCAQRITQLIHLQERLLATTMRLIGVFRTQYINLLGQTSAIIANALPKHTKQIQDIKEIINFLRNCYEVPVITDINAFLHLDFVSIKQWENNIAILTETAFNTATDQQFMQMIITQLMSITIDFEQLQIEHNHKMSKYEAYRVQYQQSQENYLDFFYTYIASVTKHMAPYIHDLVLLACVNDDFQLIKTFFEKYSQTLTVFVNCDENMINEYQTHSFNLENIKKSNDELKKTFLSILAMTDEEIKDFTEIIQIQTDLDENTLIIMSASQFKQKYSFIEDIPLKQYPKYITLEHFDFKSPHLKVYKKHSAQNIPYIIDDHLRSFITQCVKQNLTTAVEDVLVFINAHHLIPSSIEEEDTITTLNDIIEGSENLVAVVCCEFTTTPTTLSWLLSHNVPVLHSQTESPQNDAFYNIFIAAYSDPPSRAAMLSILFNHLAENNQVPQLFWEHGVQLILQLWTDIHSTLFQMAGVIAPQFSGQQSHNENNIYYTSRTELILALKSLLGDIDTNPGFREQFHEPFAGLLASWLELNELSTEGDLGPMMQQTDTLLYQHGDKFISPYNISGFSEDYNPYDHSKQSYWGLYWGKSEYDDNMSEEILTNRREMVEFTLLKPFYQDITLFFSELVFSSNNSGDLATLKPHIWYIISNYAISSSCLPLLQLLFDIGWSPEESFLQKTFNMYFASSYPNDFNFQVAFTHAVTREKLIAAFNAVSSEVDFTMDSDIDTILFSIFKELASNSQWRSTTLHSTTIHELTSQPYPYPILTKGLLQSTSKDTLVGGSLLNGDMQYYFVKNHVMMFNFSGPFTASLTFDELKNAYPAYYRKLLDIHGAALTAKAPGAVNYELSDLFKKPNGSKSFINPSVQEDFDEQKPTQVLFLLVELMLLQNMNTYFFSKNPSLFSPYIACVKCMTENYCSRMVASHQQQKTVTMVNIATALLPPDPLMHDFGPMHSLYFSLLALSSHNFLLDPHVDSLLLTIISNQINHFSLPWIFHLHITINLIAAHVPEKQHQYIFNALLTGLFYVTMLTNNAVENANEPDTPRREIPCIKFLSFMYPYTHNAFPQFLIANILERSSIFDAFTSPSLLLDILDSFIRFSHPDTPPELIRALFSPDNPSDPDTMMYKPHHSIATTVLQLFLAQSQILEFEKELSQMKLNVQEQYYPQLNKMERDYQRRNVAVYRLQTNPDIFPQGLVDSLLEVPNPPIGLSLLDSEREDHLKLINSKAFNDIIQIVLQTPSNPRYTKMEQDIQKLIEANEKNNDDYTAIDNDNDTNSSFFNTDSLRTVLKATGIFVVTFFALGLAAYYIFDDADDDDEYNDNHFSSQPQRAQQHHDDLNNGYNEDYDGYNEDYDDFNDDYDGYDDGYDDERSPS